jgi:epoxyqueuosine reductase
LTLNERIEKFLIDRGAVSVGFATLETLEGGPPSADLTYVLPEARSAVSFALPLDRENIRAFLGKKSMVAYESENLAALDNVTHLSSMLADWLHERGYESKGVLADTGFRKEITDWRLSMPPDLSHRYVAVRSGTGSFGWSGNVGLEDYGTAIMLGTTVTAAELEPTEPIPEEESFCTKCKLCVDSCASGLFERDKEESVTLGGYTFKFAMHNSYLLCDLVAGGFSGLHPSGKWSTWSPGRYRIPQSEDERLSTLLRSIKNYASWQQLGDGPGGFEMPFLEGVNLRVTCGNCQIVCWGDKEATRENYRLLSSSGCVVQREDGANEVLPPDEAERVFQSMNPSHQELYQ